MFFNRDAGVTGMRNLPIRSQVLIVSTA